MTVWLFPRGTARGHRKKTVLIVRPDSAGDFVLWLDSAKEFKKIYPSDQYKITLLASQDWADLAKFFFYWDDVMPINRKRFLSDCVYRWKFLRRIYENYYDVVVHPVFSRIIFLGDAIVRISSAAERTGWDLCKDLNSLFLFSLRKRMARSWYTRLISLDKSRLMELEKNAQFIRALGVKDFRPGIPKLAVDGISSNIAGEYFVIVPDALWQGREWPLENFVEIARRIQAIKGWKVVFAGSQRSFFFRINEISHRIKRINLIGKTKFLEYLKIIKGAKLVIANESSAVHIAAACNVPAFSITGGGHWGRFVPYSSDIDDGRAPIPVNEFMDCYGCEWFCKFPRKDGPVRCIDKISIGKAWEVISNSKKFISA